MGENGRAFFFYLFAGRGGKGTAGITGGFEAASSGFIKSRYTLGSIPVRVFEHQTGLYFAMWRNNHPPPLAFWVQFLRQSTEQSRSCTNICLKRFIWIYQPIWLLDVATSALFEFLKRGWTEERRFLLDRMLLHYWSIRRLASPPIILFVNLGSLSVPPLPSFHCCALRSLTHAQHQSIIQNYRMLLRGREIASPVN